MERCGQMERRGQKDAAHHHFADTMKARMSATDARCGGMQQHPKSKLMANRRCRTGYAKT
jgi:hypothetical protein